MTCAAKSLGGVVFSLNCKMECECFNKICNYELIFYSLMIRKRSGRCNPNQSPPVQRTPLSQLHECRTKSGWLSWKKPPCSGKKHSQPAQLPWLPLSTLRPASAPLPSPTHKYWIPRAPSSYRESPKLDFPSSSKGHKCLQKECTTLETKYTHKHAR